MLYNLKWNKQEPDRFSLSDLINWLEQKPRGGVYNYYDCNHCLICEYIMDKEKTKDVHVTSDSYYCHEHRRSLPPHWDDISAGKPSGNYYLDCMSWTYGQALDRAKAIQNKELQHCEDLYTELC